VDVTWEVYFYEDDKGNKPVRQYLDNLNAKDRAKVVAFISQLYTKGPNLPRPYADLLEDGIHELRIKIQGN